MNVPNYGKKQADTHLGYEEAKKKRQPSFFTALHAETHYLFISFFFSFFFLSGGGVKAGDGTLLIKKEPGGLGT